jgi:hypothetical protein
VDRVSFSFYLQLSDQLIRADSSSSSLTIIIILIVTLEVSRVTLLLIGLHGGSGGQLLEVHVQLLQSQ